MLSSGKEQGCFDGEKEMFQLRFNGENEIVLMTRKKRMLQLCFNGEKKKVSWVRKRLSRLGKKEMFQRFQR